MDESDIAACLRLDPRLPEVDHQRVEVLQALASEADGDAFIGELFELFCQESRAQLGLLQRAAVDNRLVQLSATVHSIGGAAGALGLARLCATCQALEQYPSAAGAVALEPCSAALAAAFEQAYQAFRDELGC